MVEIDPRQGRLFESQESEISTEVRPVVRVFPWAIKHFDNLLRDLEENPKQEPSLIKVIVVRKLDRDDPGGAGPSAGKITLLGGNLEPGENVIAGAFRELQEESTIYPSPMAKNEKDTNEIYVSQGSFQYTIDYYDPADPARYTNPRNVQLVAMPVVDPDILQSDFPLNRDKIKKGYALDLSRFEKLLREGGMEQGEMVEHCSFTNDLSGISMSDEDKTVRNAKLNEMLTFLYEKETVLRAELITNLVNGGSGQDQKGELSLSEMYRSMLRVYGPERAKTKLRVAVDKVIARHYMKYFIEKERSFGGGSEGLGKGLTKGNYGIDIMHLLPLLAKLDTKTVESTKLYSSVVDFFKGMGKDVEHDTGIKFQSIVNSIKNPELSDDLQTEVRETNLLHEQFLRAIAAVFNVKNPEEVREVWEAARELVPRFSDRAKAADPNLLVPTQRNEVIQANLPELLAISLHHPDQTIRFEASRELFIFLKALFAYPRYQEIRRLGVTQFSKATETFFGPVDSSLIVSSRGVDKSIQVRHSAQYGWHSIVDAKVPKTFVDYLGKSLQAPLDEIRDVFAYSIVCLGKDQVEGPQTPQQMIEISHKMTEEFLRHIEKQYPSYTTKIIDPKEFRYKGTETFLKYLEGADLSELGGKRAGSLGDFIVREKMVVQLEDDNGHIYNCEFAFYPFIEMLPEYKKAKFMGWKEKREDDPEYVKRRLRERINGAYGLRSMYELFFPPSIYHEARETYPYLVDRSRKSRKE